MTNFESIDLCALELVSGGGPAQQQHPADLHDQQTARAMHDGALVGGAGGLLTGAVWGAAFGAMAGGIGVIPGAIAGGLWGANAGAAVGAYGNVFLQRWRGQNR